MASSGQRKGSCGHIMASFYTRVRCARCREKGARSDLCVQGKDDFAACLLLTPEQRKQLATPTYKLQKEMKSSKSDVLIDLSQVSVVGPVDLNQSVASSPSNVSLEDSFKKELSDLKDEWSTRFARIEALLTMGSNPNSAQPISAVGNIAPVFSPVKVKVNHSPPTGVLSSSPFLPHTVSSPPPAGSAPGPGQEQVLDSEALVDKQQPETSGFQPVSSASQPYP